MKSRKIVRLTQSGEYSNITAEWTPCAYLYDGMRMRVTTNSSSDATVTAKIVLKDGISMNVAGGFEEQRNFFNKTATFDFSSYISQLYNQDIERLVPTKTDVVGSGLSYVPYFKREGENPNYLKAIHQPIDHIELYIFGFETKTISIPNPYLVMVGDNAECEDLCAPRTHYLPVNYPSVIEYIPVGENKVALQAEGCDDVDVYSDNMAEELTTMGVNLTERIDERYNEEIRSISVSVPSHLETQGNDVLELEDWDAETLDSVVDTYTRSDLYLVDNRTKGAFLRFFDRFGFVTQILLDVVSEETVYNGGDVANAADLNDNGYIHFGGNGNNYRKANTIKRTTENRVLHCSLERVTKDIRKDLEDLACSPCVALFETDVQGNEYWREVAVNCANITDNKRESLIDFDCDINVGGRQRW